jgi:hypothetical protein
MRRRSSTALFRDGLAAVRIGDDNAGKWGFIDTQGRIAVNPQFESVFSVSDKTTRIGSRLEGEFNQGLAAVKAAGKWGYIAR